MQQISQLLVIELYVWAHYEIVFGVVCFGVVQDRLKTTRDESLFVFRPNVAHHGVGLARACLPICEYCSIVSLQDFFSKGSAGEIKEVLLKSVLRKDIVEVKYFIIVSLGIHVFESELLFDGVW